MKKNKRAALEQLEEEQPPRKSRFKLIIAIVISVLVIALIVAGTVYYQSKIAPFQQTVLTVDNNKIKMDYLIKRSKIAGGDPETMLQQIAYEEVVKIAAPRLGIKVSPEEIDDVLVQQAEYEISNTSNTTDNGTPVLTLQFDDPTFKEWYDNYLKEAGFTDSEYREIIKTNLLRLGLQEFIGKNVSTSGEQVHLNVIVTSSLDAINKAKARITAGETFAAVASDVSIDTESKPNGGDVGWMPKGLTPYDDAIFSLEIGKVSDPVQMGSGTSSQFALFLVSEKEADRAIEPNVLQALQSMAFYNWLKDEVLEHTINYNLSEENINWAKLQLAIAAKS